MRTQPLTATLDMPVEGVADLLTFHNISGWPVVDGGRVVGIVTEADVIGKQGGTASDIMTPDVITVAEDTPAAEIAQLLNERRIRRVPVMRGHELVGIISRGDIVRWVAGRSNP